MGSLCGGSEPKPENLTPTFLTALGGVKGRKAAWLVIPVSLSIPWIPTAVPKHSQPVEPSEGDGSCTALEDGYKTSAPTAGSHWGWKNAGHSPLPPFLVSQRPSSPQGHRTAG